MKTILAWICGILLSALLVVVNGIASIQAIGQRSGAVFNLNNDVVRIKAQQIPILPLFAAAIISCVVLYALFFARRSRPSPSSIGLLLSFVLATGALIVWSFSLEAGRTAESATIIGILPGWRGWLEQSGTSPATLLVLILAVAFLIMTGMASLQGQKSRQRS